MTEKIFIEKMRALSYNKQSQQRLCYQIFMQPTSLYFSFKNILEEIEEQLEITDGQYLQIIQGLMESKQLFQPKTVEFIQTWIIYQIKNTFKFKKSIIHILQVVRKVFGQTQIAWKKPIQELVEKQGYNYSEWIIKNQDLVKRCINKITTNKYYLELVNLNMKSFQHSLPLDQRQKQYQSLKQKISQQLRFLREGCQRIQVLLDTNRCQNLKEGYYDKNKISTINKQINRFCKQIQLLDDFVNDELDFRDYSQQLFFNNDFYINQMILLEDSKVKKYSFEVKPKIIPQMSKFINVFDEIKAQNFILNEIYFQQYRSQFTVGTCRFEMKNATDSNFFNENQKMIHYLEQQKAIREKLSRKQKVPEKHSKQFYLLSNQQLHSFPENQAKKFIQYVNQLMNQYKVNYFSIIIFAPFAKGDQKLLQQSKQLKYEKQKYLEQHIEKLKNEVDKINVSLKLKKTLQKNYLNKIFSLFKQIKLLYQIQWLFKDFAFNQSQLFMEIQNGKIPDKEEQYIKLENLFKHIQEIYFLIIRKILNPFYEIQIQSKKISNEETKKAADYANLLNECLTYKNIILQYKIYQNKQIKSAMDQFDSIMINWSSFEGQSIANRICIIDQAIKQKYFENILRLCDLFSRLNSKNIERTEILFGCYDQSEIIEQLIPQVQNQFLLAKSQILLLIRTLGQKKSNQQQICFQKDQTQRKELKLIRNIPDFVKQSLTSIDKYYKNTQEYLKITKNLKDSIKDSTQKFKQTFDFNKPQSFLVLQQSLLYLRTLHQYQVLKIECESALNMIVDSIERNLQQQLMKIQQVILLISNDEEISSKIENLEFTLLKIQTCSQLNNTAGLKFANRLKQAEKALTDQLRSFIFRLNDKIAKTEFSIRNQLEFDQNTNLTRKILELKYLKCHKKILSFIGFQQFESEIQKMCNQKLLEPYQKINQCILGNGMNITEKLLNKLNFFIAYDLNLSRMMSKEDYQKIILKVKEQKYDNLVVSLMQKLKSQMIDSLNKVKENAFLFDNFDNLRSFKRVYSLFSYALSTENIITQMNRLNLYKKFQEIHDNIIEFLQLSQVNVLKEFKQARNKQMTQIFLERIRRYCFEMKQFDNVLEQQNNLNEINKMADQEFVKIQSALSNKLIQIFAQSSIDYKELRQFFSSNKANPSAFLYIKAKIIKHDQEYYEKINDRKKSSDNIIFDDQNLDNIKLLKSAYIFYIEITVILQENGKMIALKLSLQYLRLFLTPFVEQYRHLYQKIMENIYMLKYKSIPQTIQLFFSNLEQLTLKLMPNYYQQIKCKIFQTPLNKDFKIQCDVSQEKSILDRICKINQILRESIEADCTKVINVLKQQSVQYYDYLEQQQKKLYLKTLEEQFRRRAEKYFQQINEEQVDDEKSLKDIFRSIPIPSSQSLIKQQLSNCFREIKERFIYNKQQMQKKILEEQKNNNITEMFEIYCKMSTNQKITNKSRLIKVINNDFQSISKCYMASKYYELCNKYEQQLQVINEFSAEYQNIKHQTLNRILKEITDLVARTKRYIEDGFKFQQMKGIIQNNKIIVEAYLQFIKRVNIPANLSLVQDIQQYFASILGLCWIQIQFSDQFTICSWSFQDIQKYIRQQFCIKEIATSLIKHKDQIIQYRNNSILKCKSVCSQSLQKISKQLLLVRKYICNLSFSQFIKEIKPQKKMEESSKKYLQQLREKICLLKKVQPIYNLYGLDKLPLQGNTDNLSDLQPFKLRIANQLRVAFQQITALQQHPQKQLTIRFNLIYNLCQALSHEKDPDLSKFVLKINQDLEQGLNKVMNTFQGRVQQFYNPSFKKGINLSNKSISNSNKLTASELEFCQNQDNIDEINQILASLIIMEKLSTQLQFAKQLLEERTSQMVQLIKNHRYVLKLLIKDLKDKLQVVPQIMIIANKYSPFRPALENYSPSVQTKDIKQFAQQFREKNPNSKLQIGYFIEDYFVFKKSYSQTIEKYTLSPSWQTIKAISKDIQCLIEKSPQKQILGMILGLYGILKRNQQNEITFKPYPSQFVALSIILTFSSQLSQTSLNRTVLQMLPGEGKSVVLAVTACYLGLKQYNIYQVCHSQYLVNRDQQEFKELFDVLGVNQRIKYRLLDQLCRQIVKPCIVMQKIKNLLLNQVVQNNSHWFGTIKNAFQNLGNFLFEQPKNVILIDEIDILFSDKFEGKIFQPIMEIYDEGNNSLIKNIFEYIYQKSKTSYLTLSSLVGTPPYKALLEKYPRISKILEFQVIKMLNDVLEGWKISHFCQMLKNNSEGNYNQQQKDFEGYHQSYAYLKLKQQGLVSEQTVKNKLKICVKIGKYSYCDSIKTFGKIIGVSGTLDCLSQKDKILLLKEYRIEKQYYLPSIFAQRLLIEKKQVIASQSKLNLYRKIVNQIAKHFAQEQGRNSLIIFFKDQQTLKNCNQIIAESSIFSQSLQKIKINYMLNQQSNKNTFKMVTSNNSLTLATPHLARGIDYKDFNSKEGLYVIMTYLPSNIQELYQAKGRTARGGRPGKFKLIILDEELNNQRQVFQKDEHQFWNNKYEEKERSRERMRLQARKQHQDTLQRTSGNKMLQYLEKINFVQAKKMDRQILLIFGFQANLMRIEQYKQCLDITLTHYQRLINEHSLDIKVKYQACFFGSYMNYNSSSIAQNFNPLQKIFRTTKICSLSEFRQELKKTKLLQRERSLNKGMNEVSIQLFFKHIHDLSYHQKITSCFIWSYSKNYSWQNYKQSMQFKKHQISIKKQLKIETDMKTCQQYLKLIKSKGISVNFIGLNAQVIFKRQISQLSRVCGRQSLIHLYDANFQDKFSKFFIQKIRQAIPLLKQIKM